MLSVLLLAINLSWAQHDAVCKRKTTEKVLKQELDRVLDPSVYDIRLRPYFGTAKPVTVTGLEKLTNFYIDGLNFKPV